MVAISQKYYHSGIIERSQHFHGIMHHNISQGLADIMAFSWDFHNYYENTVKQPVVSWVHISWLWVKNFTGLLLVWFSQHHDIFMEM